MRTYRYLHLDVFTDAPFEGNQLAVFPEPDGLSSDEMQRITREMNFSECTFVFPPEPPGAAGDPPLTHCRMRIFTIGEELPMAGHPTIGSTFALAHEGVIRPGAVEFVFGLGVGPIPVSLEWKGEALQFAWMTQPSPTFGGRIADAGTFAAALGLTRGDVDPQLPIEVVSCGVPFLFAPLTSRAAVDRVSLDRRAYAACCREAGVDELPLFFFTRDRDRSITDEAIYSRMLAPGFGIAEDPATGSASGPLGCYLAVHGALRADQLRHFVSLQGVAMRRPSRIHVSIDHEGGRVHRVRVGGRSVLVGGGTVRF
jgi:trans-2,3-dihydro-3-hydroxyanthranilate isomerase